MRIISLIISIIIILLGIGFASLNASPVSINYYIGTRSLPLSLLVVLTFSVGLLLGMFLVSLKVIRLKHDLRRTRSKARIAEKEVENLRAIPLKDTH